VRRPLGTGCNALRLRRITAQRLAAAAARLHTHRMLRTLHGRRTALCLRLAVPSLGMWKGGRSGAVARAGSASVEDSRRPRACGGKQLHARTHARTKGWSSQLARTTGTKISTNPSPAAPRRRLLRCVRTAATAHAAPSVRHHRLRSALYLHDSRAGAASSRTRADRQHALPPSPLPRRSFLLLPASADSRPAIRSGIGAAGARMASTQTACSR